MASRHRSAGRFALEDRTVTERDGAHHTDQGGALELRRSTATGAVATIVASVAPRAARERALALDLADEVAADLAEGLDRAAKEASGRRSKTLLAIGDVTVTERDGAHHTTQVGALELRRSTDDDAAVTLELSVAPRASTERAMALDLPGEAAAALAAALTDAREEA